MAPVGAGLRLASGFSRKSPGFTAMALAALALGLGATTAIFSIVDAVLLKPLPFRDPDRLLVIWEKNAAQNKCAFCSAGELSRMAAPEPHRWKPWPPFGRTHATSPRGPDGPVEPEELRGERVSAALFPLLGVQRPRGRTFVPEEERPGHASYALLSHRLWERRFGADRVITGKAIQLRTRAIRFWGCCRPVSRCCEPGVDMWLPLALMPAMRPLRRRAR